MKTSFSTMWNQHTLASLALTTDDSPIQMYNSIREKAAERPGDTSSGRQHGDTFGMHMTRIPQRNVVYQAREQTTFSQSKKDASATQNKR